MFFYLQITVEASDSIGGEPVFIFSFTILVFSTHRKHQGAKYEGINFRSTELYHIFTFSGF